MNLTYDYNEFRRVSGMIEDARRLRDFGLLADPFDGSFWPDDVDDLLQFCDLNADFHIVSFLPGGLYLNRYDPRGKMFLLADGNANPRYVLSSRHASEWTELAASMQTD